MVLSTTVVATFATLLALLNPISARPQHVQVGQETESRGPAKFCIPFLTCKRASPVAEEVRLLQRQEKGEPRPGSGINARLTRITFKDALRTVREKGLPTSGNNSLSSMLGQRLPEGVKVDRPPRSLRPGNRVEASSQAADTRRGADVGRERIPLEKRNYLPYNAIGKLLIRRPGNMAWECSGVLIDRSILMTANHCLPWDTASSHDWTTIEFIPAYDGTLSPSRPYGSAFAVQCIGINPPTKDGRDIAICYLGEAIGDRTGSLQIRYVDSTEEIQFYEREEGWSSVGYPNTTDNGQVPAYQEFVAVDKLSTVQDESRVITSAPYADPGWSGGPLYSWASSNCPPGYPSYCPFVGAVVTALAGPTDGAYDSTVHVGGLRMYMLVVYSLIKLSEQ